MKNKYKYIALIVLLLISYRSTNYLLLKDIDNVIIFDKVKAGETFTISYKHSVSKTIIIEEYVIDSDYLIKNVLTRYYDQGGAGFPDYSPNVKIDEDGSFISANNIYLDEILLFTDNDSQSEIKFNAININLSDINEPWMTYEINVKKYSLIESIYLKIRMWFNED